MTFVGLDTAFTVSTGFTCIAVGFARSGGGASGDKAALEAGRACSDIDDFRSFTLLGASLFLPFLRFLSLMTHCSSSPGGSPILCSASVAFSASSCCLRNRSSCSIVSFRIAASLARVDSSTESRNSTSSSSRERNWFLRRFACSVYCQKSGEMGLWWRRWNIPLQKLPVLRLQLPTKI